jgi:antirestriction protein ArdC
MTASRTTKRDLYREITDKLVAIIEQGVNPWHRTWSQYGPARNYVSGRMYTGINFILMNCAPFPIPYFMSFKQIKENGGHVRKGAKGQMVIYFNVYFKDAENRKISKEDARARAQKGEAVQVLKFIKYYTVFNVADIEGIQFEFPEVKLQQHEKIQRCERIYEQMPQHPEILNVKADHAYYHPEHDFINMPEIGQFETPEHYYATLFHELTHSTGHASRLNREGVTKPGTFGSAQYSREEIIAEIGASFLCAQAQIDNKSLNDNNAAYLAGWLKVLKEDSTFIFTAAAEAQKAADYILNHRQAEAAE